MIKILNWNQRTERDLKEKLYLLPAGVLISRTCFLVDNYLAFVPVPPCVNILCWFLRGDWHYGVVDKPYHLISRHGCVTYNPAPLLWSEKVVVGFPSVWTHKGTWETKKKLQDFGFGMVQPQLLWLFGERTRQRSLSFTLCISLSLFVCNSAFQISKK